MKNWTEGLKQGRELDATDVASIAEDLLSAEISDEDKAEFLHALHQRGETPAEVTAFAEAFLLRAEPFDVSPGLGPLLDVCGTGGDKLGLFNVSTAVMFVAAGAGARLVKHGNRGITSKSGGADGLEALEIAVDAPVERLHGMLEETGATFLFAPRFHPAFKSVAAARPVRKELAFRTVFNMLGPLLNPSQPAFQMNGVYDHELLRLYGLLLKRRGCRFATLVSRDGYDEVTLTGHVSVVTHRGEYELAAGDFGLAGVNHAALRGGKTVAEAARIVRSVLEGAAERAIEDVVVANAGLAIFCNDSEMSLQDCVLQARESIRSGRALQALKRSADIA